MAATEDGIAVAEPIVNGNLLRSVVPFLQGCDADVVMARGSCARERVVKWYDPVCVGRLLYDPKNEVMLLIPECEGLGWNWGGMSVDGWCPALRRSRCMWVSIVIKGRCFCSGRKLMRSI